MNQSARILKERKRQETFQTPSLRLTISMYLIIIGLILAMFASSQAIREEDQTLLQYFADSYVGIFKEAKATKLLTGDYVDTSGELINSGNIIKILSLVGTEDLSFSQSHSCIVKKMASNCNVPFFVISLGQAYALSALLLMLSIVLMVWSQRGFACLSLGLSLILPGSLFLLGSVSNVQDHESLSKQLLSASVGYLYQSMTPQIMDKERYLAGEYSFHYEQEGPLVFRQHQDCHSSRSGRCRKLIRELPLIPSLFVLLAFSILIGLSLWKARAFYSSSRIKLD